jgi:hypothetical protein
MIRINQLRFGSAKPRASLNLIVRWARVSAAPGIGTLR